MSKQRHKELTETEMDILNVLYFTETYQNILEEVDAEPRIIKDCLRQLIDANLVTPMAANEKGEYERSAFYDADDMTAYQYVATRDGLLAHSGR